MGRKVLSQKIRSQAADNIDVPFDSKDPIAEAYRKAEVINLDEDGLSSMAVPIHGDAEKVIGVLRVNAKKDCSVYNAKDTRTAMRFATAFSFVMTKRHDGENKDMTSIDWYKKVNLDAEIFDYVVHDLTGILDAARASLFIKRGDHFETMVASGCGKITIPAGQGIVGHVAVTGKSMKLDDAYDSPIFSRFTDKKTGFRTRSIMAMPVVSSRGELIGVLQALNKRDGTPFTDRDEEHLSEFATYVGSAIEQKSGEFGPFAAEYQAKIISSRSTQLRREASKYLPLAEEK